MKYIILAAGTGTRLYPITLNTPKTLFRLDDETTVLSRMILLLKRYDEQAVVYVATGFCAAQVKIEADTAICINNPFYSVTNSIASLWFLREQLNEDVVIINGDVVVDENIVKDLLIHTPTRPTVLVDSSIKKNGDYNVQVANEKVLVMSKELEQYFGEYAGITRLDKLSAVALKETIENMVDNGCYDQWYENALVRMIFEDNFELYYEDISTYQWTEVDCVDDLVVAKNILFSEKESTGG